MADSKFQRIEEERQVREGFWPKIATFAANLPFAEQALAAWYCAFDRETPSSVRYTLMGALAYFVLPIDIIPDFIAGFGFTDDAAVLYAAIRSVASSIRPEHRARAKQMLEKALAD